MPKLNVVDLTLAKIPAKVTFVIPVKPVLDLIVERESKDVPRRWIPAFAGMTEL